MLRKDKSYIGGEEIEVKTREKDLYIEVGIFLLVGIGFIFLFFMQKDLLRRYLEGGKGNLISGILLILFLSPFGAHLLARMITFFSERLK